jgi:hypothetical protein
LLVALGRGVSARASAGVAAFLAAAVAAAAAFLAAAAGVVTFRSAWGTFLAASTFLFPLRHLDVSFRG